MEIEKYTIPRVIGIKQAAAEFGIAEYALRSWIKSGQLPVICCGRKHLINCTVLSRFLCGNTLANGTATQQNKPAAVGADGTLYTTIARLGTGTNGKGKVCKAMPPIR